MLSVMAADRPEELLEELVARLGVPVADPFAQEWVSVPSLGFRTWLQRQLSRRLGAGAHGDGITANIDMPLPGTLRWLILRAHGAFCGAAEAVDPWQVDRLVWSLLEVLSEPPGDLDARLSRTGLPAGVPLASRAAPIADLFDRYDVHRPDMLLAWLAGRDVDPDGSPLDEERRWQPHLYRAIRDHIAARHGVTERPAERLAQALDLIRSGDLSVTHRPGGALPPRMFVFGQSVITAEIGPILSALGVGREVTVLMLSPSARTSRRLAGAVAAEPPALLGPSSSWAFPRAAPQAAITSEHPLLGTWGRRPFESALLLGAGGTIPQVQDEPLIPPATLLARVQADLHAGTVAPPWPGPVGDGSIQVHAAPGRTRQVEVLRDVILGLLRDNPELVEGDIAVVCPQLEQYAPVISAALGPPAESNEQPVSDQIPSLRYTVLDRDARSTNSVLDAMASLLEVLPGRFELGNVTDLLHATAVQERFGLTPADLSLLSDWVDQACIRWGLDGPQREPWKISPDHDANSWAAGIDQLMMGIALGDDLRDEPLSGTEPGASLTGRYALAVGGIAPTSLDEGAIGGAGRLAAVLRSLARAHELLAGGELRTIENWCRDLRSVADLMVAAPRFEEWQRAGFDVGLDALLTASAVPGSTPSPVPLTFADMRRLLAPAFDGPRARIDLGYGSVVITRPASIASVPFRVICVLGLDEDALPSGPSTGDDLTIRAPLVGDRDPRAEARAEMLAAVAAARDHLIITCLSRDVRTNEPVPESVLLEELLELLAATTGRTSPDLRAAEDGLVRAHPRQAFHPDNFTTDGDRHPFSFDPTARDGAAALTGSHRRAPSSGLLLAEPLAPADDRSGPMELGDVHRFYSHPVRAFFRNRLNVTVPSRSDVTDEQLPTGLAPLDRAAIGGALLDVGIDLADPDDVLVDPEDGPGSEEIKQVLNAYAARGLLPPPPAALPQLAEISREVALMLATAERLGVRCPARQSHPVDLLLPNGMRLVGSVNDCIAGDRPGPVRVRYRRDKPRHRVEMALDLLVLTALDPGTSWRGVVVARPDGKGTDEPVIVTQHVAGDDADTRRAAALGAIESLTDQYREGLCYPLPLFDRTSFALHAGDKPRVAWGNPDSDWGYGAECKDDYHVMAFGSITYDVLVSTDAGGYRLTGEAERLWGTLDAALVNEDGVDGEVAG